MICKSLINVTILYHIIPYRTVPYFWEKIQHFVGLVTYGTCLHRFYIQTSLFWTPNICINVNCFFFFWGGGGALWNSFLRNPFVAKGSPSKVWSVLGIRIRIRRIRMFLDLPDPYLDPIVRGMILGPAQDPAPDPAPDPSLSHKCVERTDIMPAK